ncbi:MAG TPA: hypothetical protein VIU82_13950 [Bosea sp. (in: a-proteobacteria)]
MPGFGEEGGLAEFAPEDGFVVDDTGDEAWAFYEESTAEDGTVSERAVVNRDGSTIQSEYAASREAGFDERHTVTTPEGDRTVFETAGKTQTIRYGRPDGEAIARSVWMPDGPEQLATIQPAYADKLVTGSALLFGWFSSRNALDGEQAVMGFHARELRLSESGRFEPSFVGQLSTEELEAACPRWPDVRNFADRAANATGPSNQYPSKAVYGTYVHTRFRTYVDDLRDPFFVAERSFLKEAAEQTAETEIRYGHPRSVRVDAYELRADGTLCIYDLKTGRAGLSGLRADMLGIAAARGLGEVRRVIVMEIRPRP